MSTLSLAAGRVSRDKAEYSLPRDPRSPELARQLTLMALRNWGIDPGSDLAQDAELCVSEMVTNAVTHGNSDARLTVERSGDQVKVSVWDGGGPLQPSRGTDPEHGRGLGILTAIAGSYGTVTVPGQPGKTISVFLPHQADRRAAA